tara:strand:+ start:399 stop:980 length:582 start_codon:yes stop_codon:yes gene_type:complete
MQSPAKTNIINLANIISIMRVVLAVPFIFILEEHSLINSTHTAFKVFIMLFLIVLSDVLDGYVARKMNQISNFGKLLDPIADKICLVIVMVFLIFSQGLPFLLFFLLLSIRDVYIIIIGLYLIHVQNTVFQANKSGKYFMAITTLMMASFVFKDTYGIPINLCWFLYVVSLIFMVISGYEYHYRYIKYFNRIK